MLFAYFFSLDEPNARVFFSHSSLSISAPFSIQSRPASLRTPSPPPSPSAARRSSWRQRRKRPRVLFFRRRSLVVRRFTLLFSNQMTWTGAAPVALPPGYDPAHPERDPVGAAAAREAAARASAVQVEKAKVRRRFGEEEEKKLDRPSSLFPLALALFSLTLQPHPSNTSKTKHRNPPKTAPPRAAQEVLQGVGGQPPPGLRRARRQVHEQHQGRERDGGEKKFAALSFFAAFSLARSLSRSLSLSLSHALLSKNDTSPSQPNSGSTLRKSRERKNGRKKNVFLRRCGSRKREKTYFFVSKKQNCNQSIVFILGTYKQGGGQKNAKEAKAEAAGVRASERRCGQTKKQQESSCSSSSPSLSFLFLLLPSFSSLFLPSPRRQLDPHPPPVQIERVPQHL